MEIMCPEPVDYVPAFDQLKILRGWAGLYNVNRFAGNVLRGEWPGLKGFLLANFLGQFQRNPFARLNSLESEF